MLNDSVVHEEFYRFFYKFLPVYSIPGPKGTLFYLNMFVFLGGRLYWYCMEEKLPH